MVCLGNVEKANIGTILSRRKHGTSYVDVRKKFNGAKSSRFLKEFLVIPS